jgi:hypothetical protein
MSGIEQQMMNDVLWSLLRKKQRSNGAGFSGWTYPLFLLVFKECHDENLRDRLNPLSDLVNLFLTGIFRHPLIQPFFTIQRGIAAKKPHDIDGVRPIGIMEVLTRLASSYIAATKKTELLTHLHDHDLGQGIPSGPETAVHGIRTYLRKPNRLLIKIDTKNAFNTMPRRLLKAMIEKINDPKWKAYFQTVYEDPSLGLYIDYSGKRILVVNAEGVVQGDPISGWLFDLAYSELLLPVRENYSGRGVIILTIHDDTASIGEDPETVFQAYRDVISVMDANHLKTAPLKTKVLTFSTDPDRVTLIRSLSEVENITLVDQTGPAAGVEYSGAPIGSHEFMSDWMLIHRNRIFHSLDLIEEAATSVGVLTLDGEAAQKTVAHFHWQAATYAMIVSRSPPKCQCMCHHAQSHPPIPCQSLRKSMSGSPNPYSGFRPGTTLITFPPTVPAYMSPPVLPVNRCLSKGFCSGFPHARARSPSNGRASSH